MKSSILRVATLAVLASSAALPICAAPLNPEPARDSKLIVGFEAATADQWTADPDKTGTNLASISTDPQFAAEGKQSLKIDMSNVGGWKEPLPTLDFTANPIDITGYTGALTMDVFVPDTSINPKAGWYQLNLRVQDDKGTTYYGNRDMHVGWNHPTWDLKSGTGTSIQKIFFAENSDSGNPWQGPIYVDNVRVLKDPLPGVHADEQIITGFDQGTDPASIQTTNGVTATINTDKPFVQGGNGSLKVDFSGQQGWAQNESTVTVPATDLSKALAVRADLFVPSTSAPDKQWWQIGITLNGGAVASETQGLLTDQWNTVEIPLTADQAASLNQLTAFGLRRNSGGPWQGPIYVDNLRFVLPGGSTVIVKKGDVNGDGKVNIADATLILQFVVKLKAPTSDQLKAADITGDGAIDIKDVTALLRAIVNGTTDQLK